MSEPSDLLELDWVLREAGSGTRQIFEDVILSRGISPTDLNVVLELPSNEAVVNAVEAGAGASVLSRLVARSGCKRGVLSSSTPCFLCGIFMRSATVTGTARPRKPHLLRCSRRPRRLELSGRE